MKFINLLFVLVLAMVLVISIVATPIPDQQDVAAAEEDDFEAKSETKQLLTSEETEGRSLLQKKRTHRLTCNKFPRICRAKGSPGPECCKKKCVNILTDRHNCGKCGKKCKYNEICCQGKCVNPSFNRKHCGGCNNRCSKVGCVFLACATMLRKSFGLLFGRIN